MDRLGKCVRTGPWLYKPAVNSLMSCDLFCSGSKEEEKDRPHTLITFAQLVFTIINEQKKKKKYHIVSDKVVQIKNNKFTLLPGIKQGAIM